jgi:hypothetical protein
MIRTVKATVDTHGHVHLLESVHVTATRPALVMILDEKSVTGTHETAALSWNRPEEDEAWSHLQRAR